MKKKMHHHKHGIFGKDACVCKGKRLLSPPFSVLQRSSGRSHIASSNRLISYQSENNTIRYLLIVYYSTSWPRIFGFKIPAFFLATPCYQFLIFVCFVLLRNMRCAVIASLTGWRHLDILFILYINKKQCLQKVSLVLFCICYVAWCCLYSKCAAVTFQNFVAAF